MNNYYAYTITSVKYYLSSSTVIPIPMVAIEEGSCRDDSDCSAEQYCYHVSRQCVNYTLCSRYNRQEGQKPARNSSQCGPCLPGYVAEELGTGELAALCRKENLHESIPVESGRLDTTWIIWPPIGILIFIGVIALFGIFFKRPGRKCQDNNPTLCDDLCTMEPSAPPPEISPFINREKGSSYVPFNNNKNLKDKNSLVRATEYKAPDWVRCNPNYEYNLNNNHDDMNVLEQLHSTFETPSANNNNNNNPITWTPEQLTQEVVIRNASEYGIEQMDNNTNAAIIERNNNSSSSNISGDERDNTNNNNNNNNNSNGPTSSSNSTRDGRDRARNSNILIAHVNVNVSNVNMSNRNC